MLVQILNKLKNRNFWPVWQPPSPGAWLARYWPGSSHKFHHKLNRRVKQWQQGAKNRPANAKRPKELQPRGKRKQRAEKRKKAFGTSCLTFRISYDTRKKSSAATLDFF